MSEQILNGTRWFTLEVTGQKTNQKQTQQQLKTTQKSRQHKIQQNKTSLVQSFHTTLGQ